MRKPEKIIISRTDAIGDVALTLPLAGVLKHYFPSCKIFFFGRTYTEAVIRLSKHIDEFVNYDLFLKSKNKKEFLQKLNIDTIIHVFPRKEIALAAKQARIKNRIGTTHRAYHWLTCNLHVSLGRKKSVLHESQLNLKLLQPLGIEKDFSLVAIAFYFGFENIKPLKDDFKKLIDKNKFNLILHPKSHASAREWSLENFKSLIQQLPKSKFKIFITGSEKEKEPLVKFISDLNENVTDLTGKMTLEEFISFINNADGLIAASTGPLHIAAALNKHALGIYPPIRPQHPGRWAPVGNKAEYLVNEKSCNDCRKNPAACACMNLVTPEMILNKVMMWIHS